jgi:nucleoside-diphosphate-sugar epimerase
MTTANSNSPATSPPNVFIVGCGDIGHRVAKLWQQRGAQVRALARSADRAAEYAQRDIRAVTGDLDDPASLTSPSAASVVYYFAPPPTKGTTDPRMSNLLGAITERALPARIVYISTSGVYGDVHGAWVTEESPTNPTTDRSRRRLDAETKLRAWCDQHDVPFVILRVPGIYGPGRLPIDVVKSGRPILRESESGYTNRIHADDLAAICVRAGEPDAPPGIYNVSDGQPGTMAQYFKAVADLLGVPHPPEVSLEEAQRTLSAEMMSYLTESRRVDNSRMLRDLAVALRYPTLVRGLHSA